jgi:hypothetical protein
MAAKTTAASGNWSAAGTWTGGVPPTEGDTCTINHTVTVDTASGGSLDIIVGDDTTTAAVTIGSGGVLQWVDATGIRTFTLKGDFKCNSGGQLLIGTSGSPITNTNKVTIKLNYSGTLVAAKYNWLFNTYSATSVFKAYGAARKRNTTLTAQAASGQNQATFADVTGWQNNDEILLGTTTTSVSQCELLTIQSIAGNTVTFTGNLSYTHASGADCSNFSSSIIFQAYNASYRWYGSFTIGATSGANFVLDNVLIRDQGGATSPSPANWGWSVGGNSGIASMLMTNCALRPSSTSGYGVAFSQSGAQGSLVQNCCCYGDNSQTGIGCGNGAYNNTIDQCNFYRLNYAYSTGYSSGSIGNTLSNCICCACNYFNSLSASTGDTFISNKIYSNQNWGHQFNGSCHIVGIRDFGSVYGVGPAGNQVNSSGDLYINTSNYYASVIQWHFENCTFHSSTLVYSSVALTDISYVSFENCIDKDSNTFSRTMLAFGTVLSSDSAIYKTSTPSLRITPGTTTVKSPSAICGRGMKVPVASGKTITINVYVRYSVVGDSGGANYNGAAPRLIVRRHDALGYTVDTVLDTHSGGAGWELLTGTTSAASVGGAFEFIVDCDGTAGWINIDDWSAQSS